MSKRSHRPMPEWVRAPSLAPQPVPEVEEHKPVKTWPPCLLVMAHRATIEGRCVASKFGGFP